MNRETRRQGGFWGRPFKAPYLLVSLFFFSLLSGCATVAPEKRAILADPTMQFNGEAKHDAPLRHAIDNREGSTGGAGVSGGGCGCN